MNKYKPLFFVETYLVFTLILLFWGPIEFRLHNIALFGVLLFLYHGFFVFGYCCGVKTGNFTYRAPKFEHTPRRYNFLLLVGSMGAILTYKNVTLSDSFLPIDIFEEVVRGFSEPGLVYAERMTKIDAGMGGGSRLFNIFSIFFLFAKLLFLFYCIWFWRRLSIVRKTAFVTYFLFLLSIGFASGTNSAVFQAFLFLAVSVSVVLYVNKSKYFFRLMLALGVGLLFVVLLFGRIMVERGGDLGNIASVSPLGDVYYRGVGDVDHAGILGFIYYSFVWLVSYVAQGYYGFSLALGLEHYWTFGFGGSQFLQRQFEVLTGVNVGELTFQARISQYWHESAQWHSFYGQLANDVGFSGLCLLLCILGFLFSRVCVAAIYHRSFFASALIPVYVIMFIFFPANNQIFGFVDTVSYFLAVHFFWLFEKNQVRCYINV